MYVLPSFSPCYLMTAYTHRKLESLTFRNETVVHVSLRKQLLHAAFWTQKTKLQFADLRIGPVFAELAAIGILPRSAIICVILVEVRLVRNVISCPPGFCL